MRGLSGLRLSFIEPKKHKRLYFGQIDQIPQTFSVPSGNCEVCPFTEKKINSICNYMWISWLKLMIRLVKYKTIAIMAFALIRWMIFMS